MNKAYFFPRLIAYFVDIIIVTMLASLISFMVPKDKNIKMLNDEYLSLQEEYLAKEIDESEFLDSAGVIIYESDYANAPVNIIQIIIIVLYFIVFQFYNKGQTFGKKLMGIKVVSNDGSKLNFNSMVYRSLIIDSVFISFITFVCLFFMKVDTYYYLAVAAQLVNGIIFIATIIMVLFRKDGRGLHDIISGTKVVMID